MGVAAEQSVVATAEDTRKELEHEDFLVKNVSRNK
jgi:hypothetical protein